MTDSKEKEFVNVFGKKFMGGPHGLGDPDDLTLRQLEDQVCLSFLVFKIISTQILLKFFFNCLKIFSI
jgi:hypothetical protein